MPTLIERARSRNGSVVRLGDRPRLRYSVVVHSKRGRARWLMQLIGTTPT